MDEKNTSIIIDEYKAKLRALEDRRDEHFRLRMRNERLLHKLATINEMCATELKQNTNLKKIIHQFKEIDECERKQSQSISAITSSVAYSVLDKVMSFAEHRIAAIDALNREQLAAQNKKLQDHIDDDVKNNKNPLYLQVKAKQAELSQLKQQLVSLKKDQIRLEKDQNLEKKKEKHVQFLLHQGLIVDMVAEVLRYRDNVEKLKDQYELSKEPLQESNKEKTEGMAYSSNDEEMFNEAEAEELRKQNYKDDVKMKADLIQAKYSKRTTPSEGSLRVDTKPALTSQKCQKVTFAEKQAQSCSYHMNFPKYNEEFPFYIYNFKVSGLNDDKMETSLENETDIQMKDKSSSSTSLRSNNNLSSTESEDSTSSDNPNNNNSQSTDNGFYNISDDVADMEI